MQILVLNAATEAEITCAYPGGVSPLLECFMAVKRQPRAEAAHHRRRRGRCTHRTPRSPSLFPASPSSHGWCQHITRLTTRQLAPHGSVLLSVHLTGLSTRSSTHSGTCTTPPRIRNESATMCDIQLYKKVWSYSFDRGGIADDFCWRVSLQWPVKLPPPKE